MLLISAVFRMQKLKILPFQIIENKAGVILKRGVSSFVIDGACALTIMRLINNNLEKDCVTKEELLELFIENERTSVSRLLDNLIKRGFIKVLNSTDDIACELKKEYPQDVFYWHFNTHQAEVARKLNEQVWVFVGVNELIKNVINILLREGKNNYFVIDDPCLRNVNFFDDAHKIVDNFWCQKNIQVLHPELLPNIKDLAVIVVGSEFGGIDLMIPWNDYAIRNSILFYPIFIRDMFGYAGPLVVDHNSACLTCLSLRQYSNVGSFTERSMVDKFAYDGQGVVSYHSAMLNILTEVGVFDLLRFKLGIYWEHSTFCEIGLLGGNMIKRKLQKVPRCYSCSALKDNPLVNIKARMFSQKDWERLAKGE